MQLVISILEKVEIGSQISHCMRHLHSPQVQTRPSTWPTRTNEYMQKDLTVLNDSINLTPRTQLSLELLNCQTYFVMKLDKTEFKTHSTFLCSYKRDFTCLLES
jgi:hypothetical protein